MPLRKRQKYNPPRHFDYGRISGIGAALAVYYGRGVDLYYRVVMKSGWRL